MLRLRRRAPMLGVSLAMMAVLLPAGVMAGGPTDLLPDLRMAKPTGIRLDFSTLQNRRLLRFDAIIVNPGKGPLVVRGKRDCATSACPEMRTVQRIKQSNGTWRRVATDRPGRFDVGDGHNHWHVMKVQYYELFQLGPRPAGVGEALAGAKTGFCFFDTSARRLSLPGAPQRRVFSESGCGRSTSTSFRMGLSVGWGDLYGAQLPRQWIDTTGIDDGRYLLCSTANAEGDWLETNTTNNQAWAELRLVDGDTVQVLNTGRSACASQLPATSGARSDEMDAVLATAVTATATATAQEAGFRSVATTGSRSVAATDAAAGAAGLGFLCAIDSTATAGILGRA